jgi:hypothetical protein
MLVRVLLRAASGALLALAVGVLMGVSVQQVGMSVTMGFVG